MAAFTDPTTVPVEPVGGDSGLVMGLDWDAGESARAEQFAINLAIRGQQLATRIVAASGNHQAYLSLLRRTSAARRSAPTHIDVRR